MSELRERVGLIHKLRKLRGSEELFYSRGYGTDVHQGLRRCGLDVLNCHPLLYYPLHPRQAYAELVLQKLSDRAEPPVAEVVYIVDLSYAVGKAEQIGYGCDYIVKYYMLGRKLVSARI